MDPEGYLVSGASVLVPVVGFAMLAGARERDLLHTRDAPSARMHSHAACCMSFIDYTIFSFVTNALGITFQPASNYKIVKGQEAIIKNVRGLYYATGFITANLFPYYFKQEESEAGAAADEEKMVQAPESWERAIMNLDFPFKYHVLSVGLTCRRCATSLRASVPSRNSSCQGRCRAPPPTRWP